MHCFNHYRKHCPHACTYIGILAYLGFGGYLNLGTSLWGEPLNYYVIPIIVSYAWICRFNNGVTYSKYCTKVNHKFVESLSNEHSTHD